jgi:hypothetical protein
VAPEPFSLVDPLATTLQVACTKAGPTRPSTVCFISLMGTIPSLWHAAAWEQQTHSAHLEIVDKSSPARRPYRRLKKLWRAGALRLRPSLSMKLTTKPCQRFNGLFPEGKTWSTYDRHRHRHSVRDCRPNSPWCSPTIWWLVLQRSKET